MPVDPADYPTTSRGYRYPTQINAGGSAANAETDPPADLKRLADDVDADVAAVEAAAGAASSGVASDLADHEAATTGVHGIADTSVLVTSARQVIAGTGLTGGGTLAADRTLAVAYGSSAGTAAQGNDSRLSDTRTPTDGSVTTAKIAAGGLAKTAVTGTAVTAADTGTVTDTMLAGSITPSKVSGTAVVQARTITAGTGLTGGGDLSANRTFGIAAGGVTAAMINASATVAAASLTCWGHSYIAGAGPGVDTTNRFSTVVADTLGLPEVNHGVGGSNVHSDFYASGTARQVIAGLTRPERFAAPGGAYLTMWGLNDLNHLGNTASALAPLRESYRAAISRMRQARIFEDTDASVTLGGVSWVTNTTPGYSGTSVSSTDSLPPTGATVTIVTPIDFPGGTMVLGFLSWGLAGGVVSGDVDGTTYTIDTRTGGLAERISPRVLRIPDVPAGIGTYVFTVGASSGGAPGVVFDYWAWEPPEEKCPLVVLVKQPKPLNYDPFGSTAPGPPTDAGVDALNGELDALAAEFGSRVITVDTSILDADARYWDAANVHPNVAGNRIIADLVVDAVRATAVPLLRIGEGTITHTSGAAAPAGLVAAAPGSTYIQTVATTSASGWLPWVKATGTGTSGWVAGQDADTGWREVKADVLNSWTAGSLLVRRVGNVVHWMVYALTGRTSWADVLTIPAGFTPASGYTYALMQEVVSTQLPVRFGASATVLGAVNLSEMIGSTWQSASWSLVGTMSYPTDAAWPTTLPGVAV